MLLTAIGIVCAIGAAVAALRGSYPLAGVLVCVTVLAAMAHFMAVGG